MPLTALEVRQAKAKDKPYRLFDGRGLYLQVSKTGSRLWRGKYRFNKKEKLMSLGPYPEISLADAREAWDDARRLLRANVDPMQAKKAEKVASVVASDNTFEAVAERWVASKKKEWAESHARMVRSRLKLHVNPWIGTLPIAEITKPIAATVLARILDAGKDETARRVAKIIASVLDYGETLGVASAAQIGNLCRSLPKPVTRHYPAILDPEELGNVLRAFASYHGSLPVVAALRLLPMLFVRPGELRAMEWCELDLEAGEWIVPGRKMKGPRRTAEDRPDHSVPLPRQAVDILTELEPLTGHRTHVFTVRSDGHPISDNTLVQVFRRLDIPKEKLVAHGFRATARTLGAEVLGFRADLLEYQLGHTVRDPNGRAYNRTTFAKKRRKMMQQWADYLEKLTCGSITKMPQK